VLINASTVTALMITKPQIT